ncbi:hypothetical protein OMR58_11495 [Erwinia sp. INIA-01]|nr:hypothetical protein [Erwinia sp. INIA01]MCW1875075.1 hypothetical protein [Erwinia sp. INIA01]
MIVSMVSGGGIYALLTFVLKIESVSASDTQSKKLKANHPQKAL